jgi:hypothetical protein
MTTKRSGFSTRELDRILDELTKKKQEVWRHSGSVYVSQNSRVSRETTPTMNPNDEEQQTKPRDCLITKKPTHIKSSGTPTGLFDRISKRKR